MKNKIYGCPEDVQKMSRRCAEDVQRMPRGLIEMYNNANISIKKHNLKYILYSLFASKKLRWNLPQLFWMKNRVCPEGVQKVSRGCPEGVQRVSRGCPESVHRVS